MLLVRPQKEEQYHAHEQLEQRRAAVSSNNNIPTGLFTTLPNQNLRVLYRSPNTDWTVKSRRLGWAGH